MCIDNLRLMRLEEVLAVTGLSKSTLYVMVRRGEFPAPVRRGRRAVAWPRRDVVDWLKSRPSTGGDGRR